MLGVQSERFVPAANAIAEAWGVDPCVIVCDVSSDESVRDAAANVAEVSGGTLDAVLHSVAYAPPAAMKGCVCPHQNTIVLAL